MEYSARIIDGDTNAPTPMIAVSDPPGAPTVVRPGPLLPADDTKTTLWRLTSSAASFENRPRSGADVDSPYLKEEKVRKNKRK